MKQHQLNNAVDEQMAWNIIRAYRLATGKGPCVIASGRSMTGHHYSVIGERRGPSCQTRTIAAREFVRQEAARARAAVREEER